MQPFERGQNMSKELSRHMLHGGLSIKPSPCGSKCYGNHKVHFLHKPNSCEWQLLTENVFHFNKRSSSLLPGTCTTVTDDKTEVRLIDSLRWRQVEAGSAEDFLVSPNLIWSKLRFTWLLDYSLVPLEFESIFSDVLDCSVALSFRCF